MKSGLKHFVRCLCPATKADMTGILMKVSELEAKLQSLATQIDKATTEIKTEIANLTTQLGDTEIPPGAQASLDALTAKVQILDDINPDAPAEPPPAAPPSTPPPA